MGCALVKLPLGLIYCIKCLDKHTISSLFSPSSILYKRFSHTPVFAQHSLSIVSPCSSISPVSIDSYINSPTLHSSAYISFFTMSSPYSFSVSFSSVLNCWRIISCKNIKYLPKPMSPLLLKSTSKNKNIKLWFLSSALYNKHVYLISPTTLLFGSLK